MKLTTKLRTAVQTAVDRRHFLSFLGATTAALGLPRRLRAAPPDQWDLIVVGGGNAGLPAALFGARRGARVLIIEAAGVLGGTLHLSTGQMSAAGTKLQKSKGIEDSPQNHYDDVMRISKNTADPDLIELAVFNAADTFDWLMDGGLDVYPQHPVTGTTHEPYSHARYAWGKQGGRSLLKILETQLKPQIDSGQVTLALSTEVTDLVQDEDGAVTGVVSRNLDGEVSRHSGHNILLSCGGYASNPEMFEELEGAKDYSDVSYEYSQGAGITLGLAAGGYVRGGEHHLPLFGGIMMDDNYPSRMIANARHFPPNRPPWEILVNVYGERFLREDIPSHDAYEHALLAQPEERCWVVFDEAMLKQAPKLVSGGFGGPFDLLAAFDEGFPSFFRSQTLAGLANAAGIDPQRFEKTVASYNEGQQSGNDALGRTHMPLPIAKAPYYAIQLQSWLLTTYAGLAVDKELRVVRADKTPIKGLYAAGELLGTGALMGRSYCGGMMVTPALTFGRLLGQSMLKFPA
jgi:fumarate reductase flavoprotein subunit